MKESAGIVGHMMRVIVALTRVTLVPMTVADCIPNNNGPGEKPSGCYELIYLCMTERNKKKDVNTSALKIVYTLRGDGCEYELVLSGKRMVIINPNYPNVPLPLGFRGLAAFCVMHKLSWLNEDGSTTPCLLPLEQLVAEIQQYNEQTIRIIHIPTGRTFIYLLKNRIFIDENTGKQADMPSDGVYMDSPLRPDKFTNI